MLLLMLCYLDEKVILFVDTEFLFIYFIPNSDNFINLQ